MVDHNLVLEYYVRPIIYKNFYKIILYITLFKMYSYERYGDIGIKLYIFLSAYSIFNNCSSMKYTHQFIKILYI